MLINRDAKLKLFNGRTATRDEIESILNGMAQTSVELGDDHEFKLSVESTRLQLGINTVVACSIFGSLLLLLSSVIYLSVPAPAVHVTTQDGKIIKIIPAKVER